MVVDDRLPTKDGSPLFVKSGLEYWSLLALKAYAKIHGGYHELQYGSTCAALEDFTGE